MKTALIERYRLIQSARLVSHTLGADAADRFIERKTGSCLKATIAQFFNNKEVDAAGITRRTPSSKIVSILEKPHT